jgi:23S rRNA (adenine2503-C2)-methyltransferase
LRWLLSSSLLGFTKQELSDFIQEKYSVPAYVGKQLYKWLHQKLVTSFTDCSNISKSLISTLSKDHHISDVTIAKRLDTKCGTVKWLLKLSDHNIIEMVYIPDPGRGTLCVSSQVGCSLNCKFCATGAAGFNRNLSLAEIMSQIYIASLDFKITNVVFMGMGEPLMNLTSVVRAIENMRDPDAYNIGRNKITVSTSGVLPKISLLAEQSDCALAVSLHAANDDTRTKIMPINKAYPIKELLVACNGFLQHRTKKDYITFEYVMLQGVNDSINDANELIKLARKVKCKVNLIPFNPFSGSSYKCSPVKDILAFQKILIDAGVMTFIRKTRGQETASACGQLSGDFMDRTIRRRIVNEPNKA